MEPVVCFYCFPNEVAYLYVTAVAPSSSSSSFLPVFGSATAVNKKETVTDTQKKGSFADDTAQIVIFFIFVDNLNLCQCV